MIVVAVSVGYALGGLDAGGPIQRFHNRRTRSRLIYWHQALVAITAGLAAFLASPTFSIIVAPFSKANP